jgi:hypothetical protein
MLPRTDRSREIMVMRRAILGIAFVSSLSTGAVGFEPKDASYFCTAEISAGLAYNKLSKKWNSATFQADEKFVLRMKYLQSSDFKVTITPAGSNDALPCVKLGSGAVQVNDYDLFRCTTLISEYLFSLRTNRFLVFYGGEYVPELPENNSPDTPAVTGGTCTKID